MLEVKYELWDVITEEDKQNGYKVEDFMISVYDKQTRHNLEGTDLMYTLIDKTPDRIKHNDTGIFAFVIPEIGWSWTVFNRYFNINLGSWCFVGIVDGFEKEYGDFCLDHLFKLCMKRELDMYIVVNPNA